MRAPSRSIVCLLVVCTACAAAHAVEPSFRIIDSGLTMNPHDISGDGTTIVGVADNGRQAWRWTEETGVVTIGGWPGSTTKMSAKGTSYDGTYVVGQVEYDSLREAWLWTQAGGMVGLGFLPGGDYSGGVAVSDDGSVVAGSTVVDEIEAFRWTEAGGMVGLGVLPDVGLTSIAEDMSADGTVIVGQGDTSPSGTAYGTQAFRWTEATGMIGLGTLGGEVGQSWAFAVSSDGSTAVGENEVVIDGAGRNEAYRWTEAEGMVGLGDLPGGYCYSRAYAASGNGSVIVGWGRTEDDYEAFIWDAVSGMRSLRQVLIQECGLPDPGMLFSAKCISDDGQIIVGHDGSGYGTYTVWMAVVPRPSPTHHLTVNSGTGDGDFAAVAIVDISAVGTPGMAFDCWIGDTSLLADAGQQTTSVTMPASDAEVTATITSDDTLYELIVDYGDGDGSYLVWTVVEISADPPGAGRVFVEWVGDTACVGDVDSPDTTLTMPGSSARVTANYVTTWPLTVTNGTGDGSYPEGQEVTIAADPPPSGKLFAAWAGDIAYATDRWVSPTTVTMPAAVTSVTAAYGWAYQLTVDYGSGDGDYLSGTVVDIQADPPPLSGMLFVCWEGDTSYVADAFATNTTVTMPAGDVAVTAFYTWGYYLTVYSGTGDGLYLKPMVIDIQADPAPTNMQFDQWTGAISQVADKYAETTTFVMPGAHCWVSATYEPIIPGDLDCSGFVGQGDLDIVLNSWGSQPPLDPRADPSGDGSVGQGDLDIVLDCWGAASP